MPEPVSFIEKIFERTHRLFERLSLRWDAHANRRTVIILLLMGAIATFTYVYIVQPPDSFPVDTLISVPKGQPLSEVADNLQNTGVVSSAVALRAIVKLMGGERAIHAGDYIFKEPSDLFTVARALIVGKYGLEPFRIRIHEGATAREMAKTYSRLLQRFNAENFLAQSAQQEGYLFPDTYFFLPNVTEDTVIQAMRQNFDAKIAPLLQAIASSTRSLSDIVIMASIIEREARNSADRRMISGVLWNRLAKEMPLQVDVSFLYTVGKGTYQLTNKDLQTDSPYNTYMNKGLPPTAIGSPSLDSLQAAVNPTPNNYLYFLADRNGVTYFSKTYAEHLRKKNLYINN
ncbi:hypothetical protein A3D71_01210 [Candidatus Kaiserbacteria bacterium RIFCSPHIGHO2_02_FULL_55_20]|uniref:Endolytic murein transglycosylase n=1 Tax=Candidatus Kaiserbacteria bacterium RIFCSPHIGHO2_02_FULL_55_20 TaxID=1798497 RepID=A0A1F6DYJ2_9BACT|nr:MAG: hypothetical protein A2680_01850 [Candidatus Kaiserbacteria bacterium RIFCSPHIGHO2_01_FULL_55_37]OGG66468.1 MAG: hypothetical protein A3D71_01210 [Candidatus Kaiserbacteria bacterium RIFCSPHIGHO2_02_FULL_55_20]